jgi:glycosidase
MMRKILYLLTLAAFVIVSSCSDNKKSTMSQDTKESKVVVYQVFTRLFGNTKTTNKPWGTIEENGVGKFADFTDVALEELNELGITHIWYTGVPHHAVITDYTQYGISNDDPDVVKGRAGSPYAVKDYYNVNPDLAINPANRLEEFEALIDRTHKHGMKVIIDIVPNHVARKYEGLTNPEGVEDFGASDDTSVEYSRDNNFYYIPGQSFSVPTPLNNYKPLGGEAHPLADDRFEENPAKWTGNGSRAPQPGFYDWYETVKINYGVKPDGTYDFDTLPGEFAHKDYKAHFSFWSDKDVPDSWDKFKDICIYWIEKGVDGFRFDMAEMVPVEFWSYLNSSIKMKNPNAFLLAEVYQPHLYRDYIHKGKMDYLYDKVELYDTLKHIIQGHGSTDNIVAIQNGLADIEHHMLHFLENHDEQRIASPDFAGSAVKGKPMMVLSTTISTSPTMIYFAQEVGEAGEGNPGFGSATRTTIFDYWGVPSHQRWMNNGAFDGGLLTDEEKDLRDFYKRLLNFSTKSTALMGDYREIHSFNRQNTEWYNDKVFSFVRWSDDEKLLIISNFNGDENYGFELQIPSEIVANWKLEDGSYTLTDQLYGQESLKLSVEGGLGKVRIDLNPLESFILALE